MTPTPPPGDELKDRVLGGRYRMVRLLGRGGMGAVWVARDQAGDLDVAVKVVKASLVEDAAALQRFRREAKVMAGLSHDNIVRGVDAGEDDGVLWLAMELLSGETLRERLDARGRLPWQESLAVVRQIASGLGAAHRAGVVHRDLKPENIMMVPGADGAVHVKLLDFGVAKASQVEGGQSSMTGTGFIVGTPGYVAPEVVLEGKTNDPRTDFYALGVVWYEMVTGQKPFTAKTAFALAMRHAHERPPTFNEVAPFAPVPTPVENVVMRLMGKSPEERPPDAASLLVLVDGLEKGAQAAAAGTPLPDAFDATLTDVRETPNGTAVVPIKLTPTPRPDVSSNLTPATGLAPAAQGAQPSSGLHLFKQLPAQLKLLMVSGAVLLPLVTIGLIAAAVAGGGDERGGAPAPHGGVPQPTDLAAAPAPIDDAAPGKGPAGDDPTSPTGAAGRDESLALALKEADREASARKEDRTAGGEAQLAKRPPSQGNAKANQEEVKPPPALAPAPAATRHGVWSFGAPGRDVKLVLDGKPYDDPPFVSREIAAGEHTLVVLERKTGAVLLTRTFAVDADKPFQLVLPPGDP